MKTALSVAMMFIAAVVFVPAQGMSQSQLQAGQGNSQLVQACKMGTGTCKKVCRCRGNCKCGANCTCTNCTNPKCGCKTAVK